MSESDEPDSVAADAASTAAAATADAEDTVEQLEARIEALAAENARLRREYAQARQTSYRRSALALAVLGFAALAGAAAFPTARDVLLALGGTGLFGAVLTYYLTPERFVPESVGERIVAAHAANQQALIDELGLQDTRVYVPTPDASEPARLFVPQRAEYDLPASPRELLVIADEPAQRGVAFVPTGGHLYEEFERTVTGEPASEPGPLAAQLADAVVETFELATAVGVDPDLEGGRLVFTVTEPVYGHVDAPDHPVVSVIATGLAVGRNEPVVASVRGADRTDVRIIIEWHGA